MPPMLDATGKKLLRLLEPDHPAELRYAAAKVLGEIGVRDAQIVTVLCAALSDPDQNLRFEVLAAIGQLKIDQALPQLLARIQEGGPEAELAAQAVAPIRPKGPRAPQHLHHTRT